MATAHHIIKIAVRGCYDMQQLRIQTGNRIVANFRSKIGIEPGEKAQAKEEKLLKQLRRDYKLITDAIVSAGKKKVTRTNFVAQGVIDDYTEYILAEQYDHVHRMEQESFKAVEKLLDKIPVWNDYLKKVPGVGPQMAGVMLAEFDIEKAETVSKLWAYSGLDVAEDGAGRSRRKEHLIDREYEDKDGNIKTKKSITFNPFVKTKLIGVLAPCFMRVKGEYFNHYWRYRHRIESMDEHKDKPKGHTHAMATRYLIKMFLRDLYLAWRPMERLPVTDDYFTVILKGKAA